MSNKQPSKLDTNKQKLHTAGEVCEIFGITRQALNIWVKNGCPKAGRGKFEIQKVIKWREKRIRSKTGRMCSCPKCGVKHIVPVKR